MNWTTQSQSRERPVCALCNSLDRLPEETGAEGTVRHSPAQSAHETSGAEGVEAPMGVGLNRLRNPRSRAC